MNTFVNYGFANHIHPEEKLVNSQVSIISSVRYTFGLSQTGLGMRLKAYGPARGGRVTVWKARPTPLSGFTVLLP